MKPSRKKWIVFGVCLALIGAGSWGLLKLMSVSDGSSATPHATAKVMPPVENPAHELNELSVQLKKKPGHTPVLMRMAEIERQNKKLDDAATHLRQVLHNEPGNPEAHLELGRVLYEKGDVTGSIAETESVLKLKPNQVDALYNLGAIYANLGNVQRARTYWTQAVTSSPNTDSARLAKDGLGKIGGA